MAKNERIIAQDLAEIKHSIQIQDSPKINELCEILTREIKKYPVKPDVIDRLKQVSSYSGSSSALNISLDEKVKEVKDLIEILISSR